MADSKISALTADTGPTYDDLVVTVNDPGGSPANRKVTVYDLNKIIWDSNGNEVIKVGTTASAVNEITITNAATGNGPTIAPTGGNTNIDLNFATKGTGAHKGLVEKLDNPYKFSASSNTQRNSGNAAFAVYIFEDEDYDTNSNYDISTGIYTAAKAGFYHFDSATQWDLASNDIVMSIFKNGTEFRRGNRNKGVAALLGLVVSADMQLAASDTVEIRVFGSNNTSDEVTAGNYFNGHMFAYT